SLMFCFSYYTLLFTFLLTSLPTSYLTLPSFPTRRSSDLLNTGLLKRFDLLIMLSAIVTLFVALGTEPWWTLNGSTTNSLFSIQVDRKSTRLNSSHEWISYAVFCLKKKKCK